MAEHDFETIASETIYVGKIFALRADEVRMPGGNTARREVVEHYGAVAVVAVDDDNNIVLVYQYRHPLGRRLWELPAGLLDLGGEPPHITAARELKEEAGLEASQWRVLVDLDSTPGFSDESVRVYLATGLTDVGRPDGHDEEADLTLRWFPLEEAVRMALNGRSPIRLRWRGFWPPTRQPTSPRCGRSMRRGSTNRQRSPAGRGIDDHLSV